MAGNTLLSMTSWLRALSYMSTVTPRRAETLEESSERRELFCLVGGSVEVPWDLWRRAGRWAL